MNELTFSMGELMALTVVQLRTLLDYYDLPVSGNKDALAKRLIHHYESSIPGGSSVIEFDGTEPNMSVRVKRIYESKKGS